MHSLPQTVARLLTFRLSREGYENLGRPALMAGIIGTWLAGMGRYWDNPKAEFLQKLGLGSVIYILLLAAMSVIYLISIRQRWKKRDQL